MKKINFIDILCKDIENLIDAGELDKADEGITKIFMKYGEDPEFLKKIYRILGKYHYVKGDRLKSLEYFKQYEKDVSDDIESISFMAEVLIDLGRGEIALGYIMKLMEDEKYITRGRVLYLFYKILVSDYENAISIYKDLHQSHLLGVNDYIKIAYYFLIKKRFSQSKDVILNALSIYQGNISLQDEYEYIVDIEGYYKNNIKLFYFNNIERFSFKTSVYSKALRYLVEVLSIRNYAEVEIQLMVDMLIELNRIKYSASDKMLAAICDCFILEAILQEWEVSVIIERFYGVKLQNVKKHIAQLESINFFDKFMDRVDDVIKNSFGEEFDYE
ncbi:tetratricopeptide repeat protein [Calditerrivibrio nitroreducens]|uniref:Uncharacterized protein n=1 Tax=Calditerrivibrio nitroreducens (strain DSM 19672 / NBRC 101217 / Yu37-1) TaxID=768670 RepID=E4TIY5_CALNY|nr:hypothetical protein [Calditerrivibrio nitroreducens]ADR19117.1 hypothetical protein Calni_1209 [Calditerrivibrio nitroreducens DSM 19672]